VDEDPLGYSDKFCLTSRSGHPNHHIKERFNQHSKNGKALGGTQINSWYTPITHTATSKKVSTGQALFNLNKTLPKRNNSQFNQSIRQGGGFGSLKTGGGLSIFT